MQKIKNALNERRNKDNDAPEEYTVTEFIKNINYIST